jgi:hypothetical protein
MAIEVSFSDDAGWVLNKAKVFLCSKPVHHNLILTLLNARVTRCTPGRYWVATDGNAVVGVVFQSPLNFRAIVTQMGPKIVPPMVDAISDVKVRLPGVVGDAACVASLSKQIRDEECRCILYTDLGNPTSNAIYRRIGYRAVAEAIQYRFE